MAIFIEGDFDVDQLISGSSFGNNITSWSYASGSSYGDPYRYPALKDREIDDLWKCINCGKVHKLSETLECKGCGTSITEKSRFVLE